MFLIQETAHYREWNQVKQYWLYIVSLQNKSEKLRAVLNIQSWIRRNKENNH